MDHVLELALFVVVVMADGFLKVIDTPLLVLLPIEFAGKTLCFAWFVQRMFRQDTTTPLGKWLTIMYVHMLGTSLSLTALFWRYAYLTFHYDMSAWVLFMLPLDIFTLGVCISGYNVMRWNAKVDQMLMADTDERQDRRELSQNEWEAELHGRETRHAASIKEKTNGDLHRA